MENPTEPQITIPAESDESSEVDSAYGDDQESITTSLSSSVFDYKYENGRRYNSFREGTYWAPNDEGAQDAMDINHHIFLLLLSGELHAAPLSSSPGRVLDLGAGTGLWAIDMGDKYPSASITGNDLSPIQPRVVPPNVQFEIDDFTADWTYSPGSFDFIHARGMFGSVSDYPKLYAQVMKALKPGGYFEQTEIDISVGSEDGSTKGTPFEQWSPLLEESSHKFSKPMRVINDVYPNMVKAGFEDVKEKRFKMPIGGWAKDKHMKELGRYNGAAWDQGCDGWIMFLFTKFLEWRQEEVVVFCAKLREALRNRHVHAYQEVAFCYGRKPLK